MWEQLSAVYAKNFRQSKIAALKMYSGQFMQSNHTSSRFRYDINGLRAWAVMAVVLFHFRVPGFSAGFFGVDMFFVISGFLMTGIIVQGLEQGNFSVWQFYMARFRRIMPALMLLLAVLLSLGWFWLQTADYQQLGTESAYSLAFLSNIHYWRSAGYFDSVANEKWLLHTWSLGVEMQFYLLYPLFALLVWRVKPSIKIFSWSLVVLFVASFLLGLVIGSLRPVAAFYLLPTRGWEMAAGGLVFLLARMPGLWQLYRKQIYLAGLLLLLLGFVLIDSALAWPSAYTLLPVLGTACIILAAQNNAAIMVNPLSQWLGNLSYSLYLWHWPVVVALYLAGLQKDWLWVVGGLALSLVLGQLSYQLVENPLRRKLALASMWQQARLLILGVAVIGAAGVTVRLYGFEGRAQDAVKIAAAEATNKDPRYEECFVAASAKGSPGCIYGKEQVGLIVMGDSHAASVITAAGLAAENNQLGALFYGMNACATLDGVVIPVFAKQLECQQFNLWAQGEMEQYKNVPLILISRTSDYLRGPNEPERAAEVERISIHFGKEYTSRLDPDYIKEFQSVLTSTACRLAQDRPVYLMRPVPEFGTSVYRDVIRNIYRGKEKVDIRMPLADYHERNQLVWEAQNAAAERCSVKILDPLPYLCDGQYCYGSRNGRPLYYDDDHLSEYGNKYLVPMFDQVFMH